MGVFGQKREKKIRWLEIAAVAILGAEALARLAGFGHPLIYKPSVAGFELVANQSVTRLGKTTHINALGLRGPEVSPRPAANTYRIMALGDSVTNGGIQINDEQTWPLLLQAAYVSSGKSVEVINASAGGWAISNEAAWLAEHGTLGARLIILEINEKDLDQPFAGAGTLDANVSFPSKPPRLALGEIVTRYLIPRLGLGLGSSDPGSTSGAFEVENTDAELDAVRKIIELGARNKSRVGILYWDIFNPPNRDVENAKMRLFQLARANNVFIIRPNISSDPKNKKYFRDMMHPNYFGNEIISRDLFNDIKF